MNKYKTQFSKDARNDLIDIYSYIKYNLQEPDIANKLKKKIKQEIYKLEDFPAIHSTIEEDLIKKLKIRKFTMNNYIVFYKIEEEKQIIQIVRIMYGRRNWINLL